VVHVVETLTVKASYYVHYVAENDGSMEGSWLWLLLANCLDLGPLSLVYIKLMDIVESLLIGVYSTEYIDLVTADHS
jgi:hypothetical protein